MRRLSSSTARALVVVAAAALPLAACGHTGEVQRGSDGGAVAASDARRSAQEREGPSDDVTTRPPSSEAYRAVVEAEIALERGDPKTAEDLLREALLNDPASAWLRIRLAHVQIQLGDVEGARESVTSALERSPDNLEARRVLALTHVLAGEKGAAEQLLVKTLAEHPGDRPSSTMLAELYLEQGRVKDAERVIEALMTREPSAIDGWLTLARLFADRGDVESALSYVGRALERNEHAVDALELKLSLLYAKGRYEDALPVAELIAGERGDSSRTRQLYLTSLLLADEREQAEELARNWLSDDKSEEMLLVIAGAFEESGLFERARELLLAESAGVPTRRVAVSAGRLALSAGDLDEASRLLCGVTAKDGADWFTFARSLCARSLSLDGKAQEAKDLLDAALTDQPSSWRLLSALVDVSRRHPEVLSKEQALGRVSRAFEEQRSERELLDVVVRANEQLQSPAAARTLVDEALRESPENAEVLMILARLLERQGDAAAAVQIAERVMNRAERPDVDLLNFVGFTLAEHEMRPEEAERLAWQALLRGPLNGYVLDTLGWAQFRAGKTEAARDTLLRADRLSPNEPEILLHLATVHRASGDSDAAKQALARAKKLVIDDEELAGKIHKLYEQLSGGGS